MGGGCVRLSATKVREMRSQSMIQTDPANRSLLTKTRMLYRCILFDERTDSTVIYRVFKKTADFEMYIFFYSLMCFYIIQVYLCRALNSAIDQFIRCSNCPPRSRTTNPKRYFMFL